MRVLFSAVRNVLINALPNLPVGVADGLTAAGIHVGHISELAKPPDREIDFPAVTLMQQGGGSILPVSGWEELLVLVQVWSRLNGYDAIRLYEWVSMALNMRRSDITTQMNALPDAPAGGICYQFYRQWKSWPLYDETMHVWYVTARYRAAAVDFADLQAAY